MKVSRPVLPVCVVILSACGGQAETLKSVTRDSTPAVQFAIDLWPGEGIPVIEARRAVLILRTAPDSTAPVADSLIGRIGRRIAFDSTRFQTRRVGEGRVVTPLHVVGRDLGELTHLTRERYYNERAPDVSIPLASRATIEFLQYRAEGTCFVRIERRVLDAQPCPGFGKESVEVVRQPITEWWIFVRSDGAYGWLMVSDSTAQSVRREF